MPKERIVFCGGSGDHEKEDKDHLHLNLSGSSQNVTLKIPDISRKTVANIPEVLIDLLEVATYVYCADQATTRGGRTDPKLGADWRRKFSFTIPVRNPELWSSAQVCSTLQDTLGFLSDDHYIFRFTKRRAKEDVERYFEFGEGGGSGFAAESVMLFSGGLDSFAGAVQEALLHKKHVALVSHRSTPKIDPIQRTLVSKFSERCGSYRPFHVPIWINKDKALSREYTQRTRSFLYASLAATVAAIFKLSTIRFYENGVTTFNLPISPHLLGARASRTTHPVALKGFTELFSALVGFSLTVENPFIWKTKPEVVNLAGDAGCADLFDSTVSCSHTWERTKKHSHCCRCIQCITRRFATLASRFADHDPANIYQQDLLTAARETGEDRTMLESYAKTAQEIQNLSDEDFFIKFGEISRALRHMNDTADRTASNILDLHRRHAQQINAVLDNAIRDHAHEIRAGKLPDSCLIILCVSDKYKSLIQAEGEDSKPTFRKLGEYWSLTYEQKTVIVQDRSGMDYIAYLLRHPRQEFSCAQLLALVKGGDPPVSIQYSKMSDEELDEERLYVAESHSVELIDSKTKKEVDEKIRELIEELKEAQENNDSAREASLREELMKYEDYVGASTNLRGKPRKSPDTTEKTRKDVTQAISRSLSKIQDSHESLGRHLRNSIRTGTYLIYNPDKPIDWQL